MFLIQTFAYIKYKHYIYRKLNKMNITNKIPNLKEGYNEIDIPFGNLTIIGEIYLTDTREFSTPAYDSSDGLGDLLSGEITLEIDIELLDKDGENIDFELDENLLIDRY